MIDISKLIEATDLIPESKNRDHAKIHFLLCADLLAFQKELSRHEAKDCKFSPDRLTPMAVYNRAHEILDKAIALDAIHCESLTIYLIKELRIIKNDHCPLTLHVSSGL